MEEQLKISHLPASMGPTNIPVPSNTNIQLKASANHSTPSSFAVLALMKPYPLLRKPKKTPNVKSPSMLVQNELTNIEIPQQI